ncbi:MAG: M61 family peptidase [Bacteroidota bacterium]|nr:M61 family peptidase [Bacteroidota bacterium]
MHYKIFISNPAEHFIGVEWLIKNELKATLELQLPAWRPGRYELANYAKNIRLFSVKNNKGENILFKKITKDRWKVFSEGQNEILVQYEYYANQYDAGASFVDEQQLYVNPVNCLMYVVDRMGESIVVELDIPSSYKIACQLPAKDKLLYAQNFDQLADSPFVASASLTQNTFQVDETRIHFWFQGVPCPDMNQLISDTSSYIKVQKEIFGDLPCREFHFLYLILPFQFRHGVEHTDSTVIAMGPDTEWGNHAFYNDILAISSHELFHLWNVKRIRPAEMLPYDFSKENYSELGYIYEGVTTYYGDLILLRSRVWNFSQYQLSFNKVLQKHFDNPGRFNYSVAQSSFDTWLDGYVPGVKGRKVSIYMEGMLAALIADIMLLKATNGNARLDQAMKLLYEETFKKGIGYTKELYKTFLEQTGRISFDTYFEEVIDGSGNIEKYLKRVLEDIGLTYIFEENSEGEQNVKLLKMSNINDAQQYLFEIWGGL